ncbi:MAG: hypothetical protein M9899_04680 [Bdellovibrionaceae bacterium]|nr:hypothetical protein [Pseudobdellovibrionaceae bacterium]
MFIDKIYLFLPLLFFSSLAHAKANFEYSVTMGGWGKEQLTFRKDTHEIYHLVDKLKGKKKFSKSEYEKILKQFRSITSKGEALPVIIDSCGNYVLVFDSHKSQITHKVCFVENPKLSGQLGRLWSQTRKRVAQ